MREFIIRLIILIFTALAILGVLRGVPGNPSPEKIFNDLQGEAKPFELSPERGRYALLTSIVEYKTTHIPFEVARYVVPDLGYKDGKYVSLFAPGVSYLSLPLYIIGRSIDMSQTLSFMTSSIFALLNVILITIFVSRLNRNWYAGLLASFAFIFATNAFSYSNTLYQHHISAFLLIAGSFLFFQNINSLWIYFVPIIFGLAFFVDYPNGVFFAPIMFLLFTKHMKVEEFPGKIKVSLDMKLFIKILVLGLSFFPGILYNIKTYNNPFQFSGTVQSVRSIEVNKDSGYVENQTTKTDKSVIGFFSIYKLPNSMSVLLTSKDRGLVWFAPVMLLGIFGFRSFYKKNKSLSLTVVASIFLIFSLYGMWGDPWGGWAFGPRYLIPAFALISVFLGEAINKYREKWWFAFLFFSTFIFGTIINLAGSLTTNQIPPSVEETAIKYPKFTFLYNLKLISEEKSGSFIYNTFLNQHFSLSIYYLILLTLIILTSAYLYHRSFFNQN